MTLIELLLFALGIALSILFGKCFYGKLGWWAYLIIDICRELFAQS